MADTLLINAGNIKQNVHFRGHRDIKQSLEMKLTGELCKTHVMFKIYLVIN